MCLTIKLFWVKSALISFHNISVLQGSLVRERSAEITCFKHAGTLARNPFGLANLHLQGFHRWLAKSNRPPPPSLRRDRFTVPDKMTRRNPRRYYGRRSRPRSASGVASVASTFHNVALSIRTENWVKPGRASHFFLPYRIFPPSTTFSPSLRSVPSGATCR
jgi:hypothetical protein